MLTAVVSPPWLAALVARRKVVFDAVCTTEDYWDSAVQWYGEEHLEFLAANSPGAVWPAFGWRLTPAVAEQALCASVDLLPRLWQ